MTIQLNGSNLNFDLFPNNEAKVDGEQILGVLQHKYNVVTLKYKTDVDLIHLMFVKKYMDSRGVKDTLLRILCMPYARMDRAQTVHTVFTLKYVADFINSLNFERVEVIEPHSDVTCALLNNASANYITKELLPHVMSMINFGEDDYLFFPDAGAQKRYSDLRYPNFVGYKHRDFETGKIQSLELVRAPLTGANKVIIVDDLCSYGGTFLASAEAIKNQTDAKEIYLLVAHTEDSIFKGKLLKSGLIDMVFTTNTLISPCDDESKIHVFDIQGGDLL